MVRVLNNRKRAEYRMQLNIAQAAKSDEAKGLYASIKDVPSEAELAARVYDKTSMDAFAAKVARDRRAM